ncbi:hypothetical protein GYMLUDRAFT_38364 [Collybiopsis luxurians FD-317 M1]|nr:hypothetical protein GYMLUDRAFT_38364 [Collybiopsis luxurians FD-317 M1]
MSRLGVSSTGCLLGAVDQLYLNPRGQNKRMMGSTEPVIFPTSTAWKAFLFLTFNYNDLLLTETLLDVYFTGWERWKSETTTPSVKCHLSPVTHY